MACALCGTNDKPVVTIERKGKSIDLCYECKKAANVAFNGMNAPIIWIGKEDLLSRYEDDEEITKEIESLTYDDYVDMADSMADWFFNGNSNGEWFSESGCEALELQLIDKEKERIKNCPKEELPLMAEHLKYKQNRGALEQRLKEE